MFQYFVLSQLLLLLCATSSDAKPSSEIVKVSNSNFRNGFYYIYEGQQVEISVSTIGGSNTTIEWDISNREGYVFESYYNETRSGKGSNQNITSTLYIDAAREPTKIEWMVFRWEAALPEKFEFPFRVLYAIPPAISLRDFDGEVKGNEQTIWERTKFVVLCKGGGLPGSRVTWIDNEGYEVETTASTQVKDWDDNRKSKWIPLVGEYLNAAAEKGVRYGCQLTSPLLASPRTAWLDYTVLHHPNVTVLADSSTCGQVTFTCDIHSSYPQHVTLTADQ